MRIINYLIGSDIEVFLRETDTKKLISAAGNESSRYYPLVPGTKQSPHWINEEQTMAIETDNVSVEFLIPPTSIKEDFVNSIEFMLDYIKFNIPANLEVFPAASGLFEEDQLKTTQSKTFGCEPDINAWSGSQNNVLPSIPNLRSNGFHIHIGYEDPDLFTSYNLIKAMDLFAGIESLKTDLDINRRSLYGKAGSCRIKPYGVEYRVLSGFLISNKQFIEDIFESTLKAIEFVNSGIEIPFEIGEIIQDAINNNNLTHLKTIEHYVRNCRILG